MAVGLGRCWRMVASSGERRPVQRGVVLAVCCLSAVVVVVDESSVNVALPAIQRHLGASVSSLQWIVAVYTLVLASLLIFSGSLADRLGRRRVFQAGLGLFITGSLLSSVAPSAGWLIAFRAAQAIGGSMLNPVAMSIIAVTFPERSERVRALGAFGGVVGLALALGPVLGGVLVTTIGWRSIFWVNVPIGLVAALLVEIYVPESRAAHPRRFDPPGQGLVLLILGSSSPAADRRPVLS
jgi:MFS family permease